MAVPGEEPIGRRREQLTDIPDEELRTTTVDVALQTLGDVAPTSYTSA